ncbi:hypothetical protein Cpir12675_001740 [Ceratocystis pirilliformis]|uniref:PLC-like phosphodiesterase n=1 Tax=Ceratocystis pirilliformis TaxID=259994 RepID=A0ABR3ZEW7_9PEZI
MNLTRATWEDTRMFALVMNHSNVDSLSSPSDCSGPNLTQSCFWYTQAASIQSCYNEPATLMSNPEKRVIFGERKFSGTAYFSVINGTPYTMRLLKAESSSAIQVLVQFGGRNNHRGSGEVVYELVGSQDRTFKFRAYIDPQPRPYGSLHVMDVVHTDLPTQDVSNGDTIKLRFPGPGVRGRAMQWALVGSDLDGYWTSQNPPVAWMQASRYVIGDRKLKHVCMPGSHNAGMSTINGRTTFVTPSNAQNQILDIYQQLVRGSRWLDIRPCVGNSSNYMLCHYSNRFGANGISLNDAISQINLFMTEFPGELILIDLNADSAYDTSRGYSRLTSSQWDYVISHFQNIEQPCRTAGNLSETTMDTFIGDGKGCVATLKRSPIPQTNESFHGIYNENALPRLNVWSNTGSHTEMAIDQVRNLQMHRAIGHESDPSTQDTFHILSWFIKPPPLTFRRAWRYKQIVNHAGEALSTLSSFGISEFSPYSFPNVLYVDALGMPHGGVAAGAFAARDQKFEASTPHMAAMAMAINYAIVSRNCYVGGHQISQIWRPMPDVLEMPGLEGASETQGVQEVQEAQELPEIPDVQQTQDAQGSEEAQEVLEVSEIRVIQQVQEAPEIQEMQQTQDAQESQVTRTQEGQNDLEMQEFQQVHEAQDIQEPQEAPEIQEILQTQDAQDSQRVQEVQEVHETQDFQGFQEAQEAQEFQEFQEFQEAQEIPEVEKFQQPHEAQDVQEIPETQQIQNTQGLQEAQDILEILEAQDTQVQEALETQEVQHTQDVQEFQEIQEAQEFSEVQDFQQVHEAQEAQGTQEAPEMQEIQHTQDSQEEVSGIQEFQKFQEVQEVQDAQDAQDSLEVQEIQEFQEFQEVAVTLDASEESEVSSLSEKPTAFDASNESNVLEISPALDESAVPDTSVVPLPLVSGVLDIPEV